jgi:hypothetical protein
LLTCALLEFETRFWDGLVPSMACLVFGLYLIGLGWNRQGKGCFQTSKHPLKKKLRNI